MVWKPAEGGEAISAEAWTHAAEEQADEVTESVEESGVAGESAADAPEAPVADAGRSAGRRRARIAPVRTCIGCHRRAESSEMVRVTSVGGALEIGRGPGRGVWLCDRRPACVEAAIRQRAFTRGLRVEVDPHALDELARRLADR
jgi:predicted RNA-binding protein YlxR (DUF448 family)